MDNSFSSLVAKLNQMSETGETAQKHKEIKVIKKAKQSIKEKKHNNPDVNAMANLLESIDESKPNHLLGREKTKSVPSGETDGTTKNANRGKLVGEDIVDEDLIADLSSQFRDLIAPQTAVAEEEPTEAVGEFAEPLYTLQDELGLEDNVLVDELARWMDGQDIKEFVDSFRRHHDMDPIGKSKRGHWPDDEKSEGEVTETHEEWGPRGRELQELVDSYWDSLPENMQDELKTFYNGTDEGVAATIGQGIDSAVAGAGKMAVKGLKKGAKKLSKLGSKNTSTSFDGKGGSNTTTTYNEKKKDHDGDGDIDGDDYMGAKDKAIKKAMGKKEGK